ncbi:hypothetical protein COV19_01470 [Candidatus Woesearchaeota archaeon CG10_big_fil_rev_8_21_14_0_10_44_13]|nr:MAG: hypothetical protein COV19_01470 [Candidatus Woesearchaeota archaeon CG10_big_fil_rev_8_21_14_0_10_44_13]
MEKYNFQYCQKIVVLSKNRKKVLLCKRDGEEELNGVFTFIGGKMETTDGSIIEGMKREKDEEVGEGFKIRLYPKFSLNRVYKKKDGGVMILPHYLAIHHEGEIDLGDEYSEYQWVDLGNLDDFEPKIPNIPKTVRELLRLESIAKEKEFVLI